METVSIFLQVLDSLQENFKQPFAILFLSAKYNKLCMLAKKVLIEKGKI